MYRHAKDFLYVDPYRATQRYMYLPHGEQYAFLRNDKYNQVSRNKDLHAGDPRYTQVEITNSKQCTLSVTNVYNSIPHYSPHSILN